MAASNLAYFMKKYYPKAEKVMWASMQRGGFNLTDKTISKGNVLIDLEIGFGY